MKIKDRTKNKMYFVVIAICVVAVIALGIDSLMNLGKAPDVITVNETPAAVKTDDEKVLVSVSTETIREGLANMGLLITQEYSFTQVEKYTKEKKLFNVLPSSSELLYSYDGSVMAGIDFEKIEIKKDDSAKTITITLPKSEIQTVTIDKDTFQLYSEKDSLWNPIRVEDYNLSLAEFEKTARQKALDGGILERSDEQAKVLVQNFISNFPAAAGYEIIFG